MSDITKHDTEMEDGKDDGGYGPTPPTTSTPTKLEEETPKKTYFRSTTGGKKVKGTLPLMPLTPSRVPSADMEDVDPKNNHKYVCKDHRYGDDGNEISYFVGLLGSEVSSGKWVAPPQLGNFGQPLVEEYWSTRAPELQQPSSESQDVDMDAPAEADETPSKRRSDASIDLAVSASKRFKKLKLNVRDPEAVFGWRRSECGRYLEHEVGKADGLGNRRWIIADDMEGLDWDERREKYWDAHPEELVKATQTLQYFDEGGMEEVFSNRLWASFFVDKRYIKFHGGAIGSRGLKGWFEMPEWEKRERASYGRDMVEFWDGPLKKWWKRVDINIEWEALGEAHQQSMQGLFTAAPSTPVAKTNSLGKY
ncbi:hypothetical protein MBLNU230_g8410t1 [Neophaeotheca triangularis]